jgi:hypothetical protein
MIFAALWQALTAAKTLKRGESAPDMQPTTLARLVCLSMTGVKLPLPHWKLGCLLICAGLEAVPNVPNRYLLSAKKNYCSLSN